MELSTVPSGNPTKDIALLTQVQMRNVGHKFLESFNQFRTFGYVAFVSPEWRGGGVQSERDNFAYFLSVDFY